MTNQEKEKLIKGILNNVPTTKPNPEGKYPICKPKLWTNVCERCGNIVGSGKACEAVPKNKRFDFI